MKKCGLDENILNQKTRGANLLGNLGFGVAQGGVGTAGGGVFGVGAGIFDAHGDEGITKQHREYREASVASGDLDSEEERPVKSEIVEEKVDQTGYVVDLEDVKDWDLNSAGSEEKKAKAKKDKKDQQKKDADNVRRKNVKTGNIDAALQYAGAGVKVEVAEDKK
jgi:hypothetical protein